MLAKFLTNAPNGKLLRAGETEQLSILTDASCTLTPVFGIYIYNALIGWIQIPFNGDPVQVIGNRATINVSNILPNGYDISSAWSAWPNYSVWITLNNAIVSEIKTFKPDTRQLRSGEIVRIAWMNLKGGIDHYTFTGNFKQTADVEKTKYIKQIGFPAQVSERGVNTATVTGVMSYETWSDFETEQTLLWLSELTTSPVAWWVKDGRYLPIDVLNKSTIIRNDPNMGQVKLQFQLSNDITIQNG